MSCVENEMSKQTFDEDMQLFCASGESSRNIMRNKSVWNIVKLAIITKIIHHANRRNWEFGIPSFINYEYRLPVKNRIKAPVATWEYMKARKLRTKQENRDYIFIRPKDRELGMPNNLTNFAFGKTRSLVTISPQNPLFDCSAVLRHGRYFRMV